MQFYGTHDTTFWRTPDASPLRDYRSGLEGHPPPHPQGGLLCLLKRGRVVPLEVRRGDVTTVWFTFPCQWLVGTVCVWSEPKAFPNDRRVKKKNPSPPPPPVPFTSAVSLVVSIGAIKEAVRGSESRSLRSSQIPSGRSPRRNRCAVRSFDAFDSITLRSLIL